MRTRTVCVEHCIYICRCVYHTLHMEESFVVWKKVSFWSLPSLFVAVYFKCYTTYIRESVVFIWNQWTNIVILRSSHGIYTRIDMRVFNETDTIQKNLYNLRIYYLCVRFMLSDSLSHHFRIQSQSLTERMLHVDSVNVV